MTATLLPNAEQQFVDQNGVPYAGGQVAFFVPNTSTPKNTWMDAGQTIFNTNPVILDAAGRAIIYGSGIYRQILKDNLGNIIWDQITTDLTQVLQSSVSIWCGTSTGTANAQILTPTSPISAYVTGQGYTFKAGFTNTGALNLDISNVGVVNVTQSGSLLSENVVQQNSINLVVYDGVNLQLLATSYLTNISPTGTIICFAASVPPTSFLECDGSAISRITFAALFGVIGTTYGIGDGSTTFNIPDLRGYFARGWDDGAGVDPGRVFGSVQADAIKSHSITVTDPGHTHTTNAIFISGSSSLNGEGAPNSAVFGGATINSAVTGITATYTGATETRPQNVALLYMIKT